MSVEPKHWRCLLLLALIVAVHKCAALTLTSGPSSVITTFNAPADVGTKNVSFVCSFEGGTSWTATWSRVDGSPLKQPLSIVDKNAVTSSTTLMLVAVGPAHNGEYRCNIQEANDTVFGQANLTVQVGPAILSTATNATFVKGEAAWLDCNVTGTPVPTVSWKKDTVAVTQGVLSNNTLALGTVNEQDGGNYACFATNIVGTVSLEIAVTIYFAPAIVSTTTNAVFVVGDTAWLDCDVTGNPVPTVVWKKDNVAVTQTVLANNRLDLGAVNKDDGGIYTCSATNTVNTASLEITVTIYSPPSAPINLSLSSATSESVSLEWVAPLLDGNNATTMYTVRYSQDLPQIPTNNLFVQCPENCNPPRVNITGLSPFTTYSVVIFATNAAGNGDNSPFFSVTTLEAAPSQPTSVSVVAKNDSTALVVSWQPPTQLNGVITGYTVQVTQETNGTLALNVSTVAFEQSATDTTLLLDNLDFYSNYAVAVLARTSAGAGVLSPSIMARTREGAPSGPPINITFPPSAIADQIINISWSEPKEELRNGIITQYTVKYFVNNTFSTHSTVSNVTNFVLHSVLAGELYNISVAAHTAVGIGPFSEALSVYAKEKAPSQPTFVSVTARTDITALEVAWQLPTEPNGVITGYTVRVEQKTNGTLVLSGHAVFERNTTNTTVLLDNLDFYSIYDVAVLARTSAGAGNLSTTRTVRTREGVPTRVRNVTISQRGPRSAVLEWVSPENMYGIFKSYTVSVDGELLTVDCANEQQPSCNVTGLLPFTTYDISVVASTDVGSSPHVTVSVETDSEAPPRPPNGHVFQLSEISTTTFKVPLYKVPDTNGIVSYYQVIVYRLDDDQLPSAVPSTSTLLSYDDNALLQTPWPYYIAAEFSASEFDANNPFVIGNGVRKNATQRTRRAVNGVFYNSPLPSNTHFTGYQMAYISGSLYSTSGWFDPVQTAAVPDEGGVGTGTIVAIIVAVVISIAILVVILIFLLKRRRSKDKGSSDRKDSSAEKSKRKGTVKRDPRVPVASEHFEEHINQLKANSHFGFSQEYLMISRELINPYNIALKPENNPKNRYANVPAYDHSRVILQNGAEGDYINGNYIEGLDNDRQYIATQGPLPEYCHDFWTMIWEQNVATIVMLTRLEEKNRVKCAQYWSDSGSSTFKEITVTPMERHDFPDITMRTFHMTKTGQPSERNVKQYHFLAWPDFGVPKDTSAILSLIKRVNAWNPPEAGPIVVHCSAGVGRTGTYIVIDTNIKRIEKQQDISVFMNVCSVRDQRCLMVQTEDQYIFIHDALLEYIESGKTEVAAANLQEYVRQQSQTDPQTAVTGLMQEFLRLAKTNPENKYGEANKPCNQQKNRYKNVYPYDETRVKLVQKPGLDGSDYINANYIDGYAAKDAFIATQAPLDNSIADFWRMMWEQHSLTVVMLSKENESGKLKVVPYWPVEDALKIDQFLIELVSTNKLGDYLVRDLKVTNAMEGSSRVVRQYQYVAWPENGSPDSGSGMINLIGQVQKWNSSVGNRIITVHCSAGVGRTGVFIALTNLIERLKMESLIDVYHAVKKMRQQRTAMVQTRDQYEFCYRALQEYLDSFDLYGNFK